MICRVNQRIRVKHANNKKQQKITKRKETFDLINITPPQLAKHTIRTIRTIQRFSNCISTIAQLAEGKETRKLTIGLLRYHLDFLTYFPRPNYLNDLRVFKQLPCLIRVSISITNYFQKYFLS